MQRKIGVFLSLLIINNLCYASERLILKYKVNPLQQSMLLSGKISKIDLVGEQMLPLDSQKLTKLANTTGYNFQDSHAIGTGAHVVIISQDLNQNELQKVISNIANDPDVEYVEEDKLVYPTDVPLVNPFQWNMESISNDESWYGANFTGAWNVLNNSAVTPGNGVVVAVIDSGYTPNTNILANLEPLTSGSESYGYQFISDCRIAGSCPSYTPTSEASLSPKPNGLDLGDYLTAIDIYDSGGFFFGCATQERSSWHGTHVSGIVAATGYNGSSGVVGGAYAAKIVPVRVLGKCGGYISDIENGMLWAAGKYPTIVNPHPAQVINMSLGATGNCSQSYQDTINLITPDTAIVVSAGNDHEDVMTKEPANCLNVISVAAVGPLNQLAYYSNYGATIITAPGGSKYQGHESALVYSTIWGSPQAFESTSGDSYIYYEGTSMAAPHVSAMLADIISYLNSINASWNSDSLAQILQNSSSIDYNNCATHQNSTGCAISGNLNAESSINYTKNYVNQILVPNPNILILSNSNASSRIIFTNTESQAVVVESVTVIDGENLSVNSSNCIGSIAANATCSILVTGTSYIGSSKIVLLNNENVPVSTVNITLYENVPTTTYSSGGCSLVNNSNDYSILLVMFLLCTIYLSNLYRLKGKK